MMLRPRQLEAPAAHHAAQHAHFGTLSDADS
jgi:hypothetical protein